MSKLLPEKVFQYVIAKPVNMYVLLQEQITMRCVKWCEVGPKLHENLSDTNL